MRVSVRVRPSNALVLSIDDRHFLVQPLVGERTQQDIDELRAMAKLADMESRRLIKRAIDDANEDAMPPKP